MAKHVAELKFFMPYVNHVYSYSKSDYPGIKGNILFGKMVRHNDTYDLFLCIPYSFSSALAGYFTGSKIRVGLNTEFRRFLLTKTYKPKKNLHETEEINSILERFTGKKIHNYPLNFQHYLEPPTSNPTTKKIAVNTMASQSSRIIPAPKSISLIKNLLEHFPHEIILTGAQNEAVFVEAIAKEFHDEPRLKNFCGKTTLVELADILTQCELVITTDTGNAHFANALGLPTIVLFGAGNPNRSRPYESANCIVLKTDELTCLPCMTSYCRFNDTRCLSAISNTRILQAADQFLNGLKF
jgi:ADP-heptose:LPS heptosyltransferase